MPIQSRPEITMIELIAPLVVALIFITLCSLFRELNRQNFSALLIAGAGAAYLNGGLLGWEFAFCNVMTGVAYFGLKDYRFIGIGWLLHTAWDTVHHLYGTPIVPFVPLSSFGCAICDPALALWYFRGALSVFTWFPKLKY
jgi:Family of unknown function (DUF6010)